MSERQPREAWVIVVTAEGAGPPVYARLRRLLKAMLRGYGLRCQSINAAPLQHLGTTQPPPAKLNKT